MHYPIIQGSNPNTFHFYQCQIFGGLLIVDESENNMEQWKMIDLDRMESFQIFIKLLQALTGVIQIAACKASQWSAAGNINLMLDQQPSQSTRVIGLIPMTKGGTKSEWGQPANGTRHKFRKGLSKLDPSTRVQLSTTQQQIAKLVYSVIQLCLPQNQERKQTNNKVNDSIYRSGYEMNIILISIQVIFVLIQTIHK